MRRPEEHMLRRCISSVVESSTAGLRRQDVDFVRELAEQAQEVVDDFIEERISTYVADAYDDEPTQ